MKTVLLYVLFLLFISNNCVLAAQKLQLTEPQYESGYDAYIRIMSSNDPPSEAIKHEIIGDCGFIDVPLDYNVPTKGVFKLFYRLPRPLVPEKPTMLFFYGGPGGNSLGYQFEKTLSQFNVIYFDQRGTGFSRPTTFAQMQDPANFSSEFIARDAAQLIRSIGVERVAVYGHSYGTVVATIFAHLYPQLTTALVLEGVVFDGTPDLWSAPFRLKVLQRFYDSLPPETKQGIKLITSYEGVPPEWFARFAQGFMYERGFKSALRNQMNDLIALDKMAAVVKINELLNDAMLVRDSISFGAYMFHHIACQELSRGTQYGSWNAIIENDKIVPYHSDDAEICLQIPGMAERMNRTYYATNYPVTVPVTYFEGTYDGATVAPGAYKHYKIVARGRKQLILAKYEGHSPVMGSLMEGSGKTVEILSAALHGHEVTGDDLRPLRDGEVRWMKTSQGF